ncbi:MAG: hypothetical protein KKD38_02435, partial [Candidatus Delongbacteria bacterium]|nr:hypothetical protein [Candidatus Delongbacteria bacterium]MCG2760718.1 hypothetical protein [Candidatus Delongbacteria bacterium]
IWGDFANNLLRFNGRVGINAANSSYGLYVVDDYMSVYGNTDTSTGTYTYGVYGDADGGTYRNVSIYGSGASGTGENWAGYFSGNINVTGTVVKSLDQVKIDHPLDPETKYLTLSTISSDQLTNLYRGNVILNRLGKASVDLPEWFEPINTDFSYQLTAIGSPGPNLYISKKIRDNSFEISGGEVGMEVSWLLTSTRNDNYAKTNPLKVESDKTGEEKGYYIHPKAFGLSEEKSIEYQIQKKLHKSETE